MTVTLETLRTTTATDCDCLMAFFFVLELLCPPEWLWSGRSKSDRTLWPLRVCPAVKFDVRATTIVVIIMIEFELKFTKRTILWNTRITAIWSIAENMFFSPQAGDRNKTCYEHFISSRTKTFQIDLFNLRVLKKRNVRRAVNTS